MKPHNIAPKHEEDVPLMVLPPYKHHPSSAGNIEPKKGAGPDSAKKVQQSIAYMRQHLNRPLQIAKLAQVAHTSASHYFVLFKRCTGFSPMEYFIRLRMQHAGQMLVATEMSVKEVAAELGYDDPFYFSRVFKSVHGMAPTGYREMVEELKQSARPAGTAPSDHRLTLAPMSAEPTPESNGDSEDAFSEKNGVLQSV